MTRNELKDIIKECITEENDKMIEEMCNYLVQEASIIESECIELENSFDLETLAEGTNVDNYVKMRDIKKKIKTEIKAAKKLVKENKNEEAKEKIDSAIREVEELREYIKDNDGTRASKIFSSIVEFIKDITPIVLVTAVNIVGKNKTVKDALDKGYIDSYETSKITGDVIQVSGKLSDLGSITTSNILNKLNKYNNNIRLFTLAKTLINCANIIIKKQEYKNMTGKDNINYFNHAYLKYLNNLLDYLKVMKSEIK